MNPQPSDALNDLLWSYVLQICNKPTKTAEDYKLLRAIESPLLDIALRSFSNEELCNVIMGLYRKGQRILLEDIPNEVLLDIFRMAASRARTQRQLASLLFGFALSSKRLFPIARQVYLENQNRVIRAPLVGECKYPGGVVNLSVPGVVDSKTRGGWIMFSNMVNGVSLPDIPSLLDDPATKDIPAWGWPCIEVNYNAVQRREGRQPYLYLIRRYISPNGYFTIGDLLQMVYDFYFLPLSRVEGAELARGIKKELYDESLIRQGGTPDPEFMYRGEIPPWMEPSGGFGDPDFLREFGFSLSHALVYRPKDQLKELLQGTVLPMDTLWDDVDAFRVEVKETFPKSEISLYLKPIQSQQSRKRGIEQGQEGGYSKRAKEFY